MERRRQLSVTVIRLTLRSLPIPQRSICPIAQPPKELLIAPRRQRAQYLLHEISFTFGHSCFPSDWIIDTERCPLGPSIKNLNSRLRFNRGWARS
jgi:hypothetical protein